MNLFSIHLLQIFKREYPMNQFILIKDILVLLIYTLTSLVSLIGNGFVYQVSLKRHNSITNHSKSNRYTSLSISSIYLLNLALADGLSGLTIPIQLIFCSRTFLETFTCSSYICLLSRLIEILGQNASILTVCLIAFDRYYRVKNPLQYRQRNSRRLLLFIWITSGLFSISCAVSMKVNIYFYSLQHFISCQILFPLKLQYFSNDYIHEIRIFCLTCIFYIIPLFINTILCILTISTIARRSIVGIQKFQTFDQSRTRSIRLLMVIVIVFALSHLPVHFIYVRDFFISTSNVSTIHSTRTDNCNHSVFYILSYWLDISSCCHNPIIYSWFNTKYRNLMKNCYRSII